MSSLAAERPDNPLAVPVLLGIVFMSLIGFGIVVPLQPFYATVFGASPLQVTAMFSLFACGQFFGELTWGRLSDRLGRKPVLIGTILASSIGYVALAFAPNIWAALGARALTGFFAGNISTVQGYVVDVSPKDRVAGRLGLVGSALGLGFIVGPVIGGLLARPELGAVGFRPPLLAAAGLCVVSALSATIIIRESLRKGDGASPHRPGPISALRQAMGDAVLRPLLGTTLFSFGGWSMIWASYGLWAHARFGWGPQEIGVLLAGTGIATAGSQALFSGLTARRLGESRTVIASLSITALLMLSQVLPLSALVSSAIVLLFVVTYNVGQPANTTMVSRAALEGQLGANNASSAVARIFTPMLGGLAFSHIGIWAPFFFGAGCLALAATMGYVGSRALAQRLKDANAAAVARSQPVA
ncbi:MFS transporter [Phenylobacterium immobile]|uniref:MFS transporter n=1 Tax=Phenylobacterium immobile TaxID=21 RepID=UPI000A8380A9|nr:MFS transporter [Phenylobacterium immobile]